MPASNTTRPPVEFDGKELKLNPADARELLAMVQGLRKMVVVGGQLSWSDNVPTIRIEAAIPDTDAKVIAVHDGQLDATDPKDQVPWLECVPMFADRPHQDGEAAEEDVDVRWQYEVGFQRWYANDSYTPTMRVYPPLAIWAGLAVPKTSSAFDFSDTDYLGKCPLSSFFTAGNVVRVHQDRGRLWAITVPPLYL